MRNFPSKRKVLHLIFAVTLLTCGLARTVFSQASTTIIRDFVPVVLTDFVPCANGGAGEFVQVSGTLSIRTHLILNDNRVTRKVHIELQGLTGQGLTTGDVYRFVRVAEIGQDFSLNNDGFSFTQINTFMFIGQGPDNNLQIHQNFHTQVNANGEVTSMVENIRMECR